MAFHASRLIRLMCILTLGFAIAAIAQEAGNSSAANASGTAASAAVTTTSQFVFVPLGNNSSFGTDRRMSEYRINSATGALTVVNKFIKAQNIVNFSSRPQASLSLH